MPGSWAHLVARFFDVVSATPLDNRELARLQNVFRPNEAELFLQQSTADQRHGFDSACTVADQHPDRTDLIRAALFHDVGKRHANLGAVLRVVASVAIRLKLPLKGRLAAYRDHGPLGANDLGKVGAEELVVRFAANHHGEMPSGFDRYDWEVLQRADVARIHRPRPPVRYPAFLQTLLRRHRS